MFSGFPTPTNHVGPPDVSICFEHDFDRGVVRRGGRNSNRSGTSPVRRWGGTRGGRAAEVPNQFPDRRPRIGKEQVSDAPILLLGPPVVGNCRRGSCRRLRAVDLL